MEQWSVGLPYLTIRTYFLFKSQKQIEMTYNLKS